ncbi:MAG: transposase [Methanobrevibacter sp.]|nr:transposase [Methanobrevibacter sp.]
MKKSSRWFPSSKTCSVCGTKLKQLKLSNRVFACPNCDFVMVVISMLL